jgi:hypothetical protein
MKDSSRWAAVFVLLVLLIALGVSSAPAATSAGVSPRTLAANATDFCDNVTEIPKAECQALVDLYK